MVDVITEEQLLRGMESLTPTEPSANGGSGGARARDPEARLVGVVSARRCWLLPVSWERRRGALTSARAGFGEAWHDAPIRAGRAGPEVRPSANEALLNRAYVYAMQAHGHQKRASGDPFFSHPLEVAAILTELKLDDATIAAALLHDVIEDTDVTRAEIDQKFGKEIGALVEASPRSRSSTSSPRKPSRPRTSASS